MREQLKQQFKDMMTMLAKGEAVLYTRIREKDKETLGQLLEDMQNSAIAIGTTIEQVEGEGSGTVKHLEDYCELVWQYMTMEETSERFRLINSMEQERKAVMELLDTEFESRLVIAFLISRGGPGNRWSASFIL